MTVQGPTAGLGAQPRASENDVPELKSLIADCQVRELLARLRQDLRDPLEGPVELLFRDHQRRRKTNRVDMGLLAE